MLLGFFIGLFVGVFCGIMFMALFNLKNSDAIENETKNTKQDK